MVYATANLDCHLFKHSHTRSGFTCVENMCTSTFYTLYITMGHCGNTAHTLHDIEHKALCLQQRPYLASYNHCDIATMNLGSIIDEYFYNHSWVEAGKNFLGNFYTGKDSIFLDEEMRLTHSIFRDAT